MLVDDGTNKDQARFCEEICRKVERKFESKMEFDLDLENYELLIQILLGLCFYMMH